MIYTIFESRFGYTYVKGNNTDILVFTLSLDAARWHMLQDAIDHGYTWVVVRYM